MWLVITRIILRSLIVIAVLGFLGTLLLWLLTELEVLDIPGLEPINVLAGFILSGLVAALSWVADKRLAGQTVVVQGNAVVTNVVHIQPPNQAVIAERHYLERLIRRCQALPLSALAPETHDSGQAEEPTLADVYIELDTLTPDPQAEKEARGSQFGEEKRLSALDVAAQEKRLVLLGDPGSGKSSFVRHLAAWLARSYMDRREPPPPGWGTLLPLLTNLRELAPRLLEVPTEDVVGRRKATAARLVALKAQWQADLEGAAVDLETHLDQGSLLLIFDGLDEVPVAARSAVRATVADVSRQYPKLRRLIVTCRSRSYTPESELPGFQAHTLAPLTLAQIKQFVQAWYQTQARLGRLVPAEAAARIADLQRAAVAKTLQSLAENPMLLTTMALIHQNKVGLPEQRVRLYDLAVQILLHRWQKEKEGLRRLPSDLVALLQDKDRLRPILEQVAYQAHQLQAQQAGADLHWKDLVTLLYDLGYFADLNSVEQFLEYIDHRAGLLQGRGGREGKKEALVYGFPHRTFQEYLAGCSLIEGRGHSDQRRLHQVAAEGEYWYVAVQLGVEELLYNNSKGKKLFLDLAYALCPARVPTMVADWRTTLWSAYMAAQIGTKVIGQDAAEPEGDKDYLRRLHPRLLAVMVDSPLSLPERAEAGRLLAHLGDTRSAVLDVDAMPFCWVPAGPFSMGSDDPAAADREKPSHTVRLAYDYWLGQYPVTQAQYQTFVDDRGYQDGRYWQEAAVAGVWQAGLVKGRVDSEPREGPYDFGVPFNLANHPVVGLTWFEALAFGRWLTERWQAAGYLPAHWQVTLPSEAEWEKAARGGHRLPAQHRILPVTKLHPYLTANASNDETFLTNLWSHRRYPWGDDFNSTWANGNATGLNSSNAVGLFAAGRSPYGCLEMAGNVWEWSRSRYMSYPYQVEDGREDVTQVQEATQMSLRGGSWGNRDNALRCAVRGRHDADNRYFDQGLRLCARPHSSRTDG